MLATTTKRRNASKPAGLQQNSLHLFFWAQPRRRVGAGAALPSNGCPPPQQLAHMLGPRRWLQIAVGLLLLTSPTTRAPRARRKQQPSTASTTVPPRQSRSVAAASNPFVPLRDITEPELLSLLRISDTVDQIGYVVSPHCEQLLWLRYDHAVWARRRLTLRR